MPALADHPAIPSSAGSYTALSTLAIVLLLRLRTDPAMDDARGRALRARRVVETLRQLGRAAPRTSSLTRACTEARWLSANPAHADSPAAARRAIDALYRLERGAARPAPARTSYAA